jgi:peptidoglycan/LPS O-acetylase OafA/YrhL
MPLFFFIMGLLFRTGGTLPALWHRTSYLIYCYFLWSSVHIFLQIILQDYVNSPLEIRDFFMLPFKSIDQFWFLYALVLCRFMAFFASRALGILVGVVLLVMVLNGFVTAMIYVAFLYFPFVALGILSSAVVLKWIPSRLTTALIIFGFAVSVGIAYFTSACSFPCPGILPSSVLGVASVLAISKQISWAPDGLLVRLGSSSLTIFALHVILGSGCRIIVASVFPEVPAILQIAFGTIAGLFLPMLFHEWLQRRNLLRYFGFSRFQSRATG